jgi:hypothetical protein
MKREKNTQEENHIAEVFYSSRVLEVKHNCTNVIGQEKNKEPLLIHHSEHIISHQAVVYMHISPPRSYTSFTNQ